MADQEQRSIRLQVAGANERDAGKGTARLGEDILKNLGLRRAGLQALREDLETTQIPMRFFERALKETRASVTPEMEKEYERLAEQLKQESLAPRRVGFTVNSE